MESSNLLVINVLSQESYDDCRIKGSINIPLDQLDDYAKNLDKHIQVVVYCASFTCKSSDKAYKKLKEMGFENVHEYSGGMNEWHHSGFPTEGACNASYLEKRVGRSVGFSSEGSEIGSQDLKELMEKAGKFEERKEMEEVSSGEREMEEHENFVKREK